MGDKAKEKNRVCPVENAKSLDSRLRRWLQNPKKILKRHVHEGMKVLDVGCGPGLYSVAMAEMVGSGKVIAADLQQEMLDLLKNKLAGLEVGKKIKLVKCAKNNINVKEKVDFVLAFYVFHETDQKRLLKQLKEVMKPNARLLIVEPKFHVSKKAFRKTLDLALELGFEIIKKPKIFFSRAVLLER